MLDATTADGASADYGIGRNRPPRDTRFKPGRSGNPKGRPKGSTNIKAAAARAISEKVTVKDGRKTRRVNKFEAMFQAQLVKAIQGDAKAANVVTAILGKVGLLGEQEESVRKVLSMSDEAILADFVRRRTEPAEAETDESAQSDADSDAAGPKFDAQTPASNSGAEQQQ